MDFLATNQTTTTTLDFLTKVPASTTDGVESDDIVIDSTRSLWFRHYVPVSTNIESPLLPIIIYFHGGGFALGSPDTGLFDTFARRLARELPAVVVSANYRLTPDHKFPTQYEDGFEVIKFIDDRIGNGEGLLPPEADVGKWFLAGDSAGGNLAHHVAVRCAGAGFRVVRIKGILSIQPFFGGQERTESELRPMPTPVLTLAMSDRFWDAFLPAGSDRDHPAVNVFGVRGCEEKLSIEYPPTLLIVGGMDPQQDRQRRFGEGMVRSGKEVQLVEYPNAIHAFYVKDPELPECGMFISEARDFIKQHS